MNIFHGENTTTSRNTLNDTLEELRAKFPRTEVLHLEGATLTETELVTALESPSMLSDDRIIQIDNLLSRRPSKEKERLISRISSTFNLQPSTPTLLLWEGKQLTATQLRPFQNLKDCKVQEFKLSKILFAFLDSLSPRNGAKMTELLASTLKTEPAELVLFLLARRVTELLLAVSRDPSALRDVQMPWQRSQLERQARNWTEASLILFHKRLLEIDEAIKTGSTASNAITHLDILLATT